MKAFGLEIVDHDKWMKKAIRQHTMPVIFICEVIGCGDEVSFHVHNPSIFVCQKHASIIKLSAVERTVITRFS